MRLVRVPADDPNLFAWYLSGLTTVLFQIVVSSSSRCSQGNVLLGGSDVALRELDGVTEEYVADGGMVFFFRQGDQPLDSVVYIDY